MKAKSINEFLSLFLVFLNAGCVLGYHSTATSRFHVVVTDAESGLPLKGIPVKAAFHSGGGWNGEFVGEDYDNSTTDENGKCTVSGCMNRRTGASAGVVGLPGYYPAGVAPTYTGSSFIKLNRWQPDGQTLHLALDKIVNPIPCSSIRKTNASTS